MPHSKNHLKGTDDILTQQYDQILSRLGFKVLTLSMMQATRTQINTIYTCLTILQEIGKNRTENHLLCVCVCVQKSCYTKSYGKIEQKFHGVTVHSSQIIQIANHPVTTLPGTFKTTITYVHQHIKDGKNIYKHIIQPGKEQ